MFCRNDANKQNNANDNVARKHDEQKFETKLKTLFIR